MNFKTPEYRKRPLGVIAIIGIIVLVILILVLKSCNHRKNDVNEKDEENSIQEIITSENQQPDTVESPTTITTTTTATTTVPLTTPTIKTTTESVPTILSVEPIIESSTSIDKIEIEEIKDRITEKGESKFYEYTSEVEGWYRFELSGVPNNIWFNMYLYNENMEELNKNTGISNGSGITHYLEENTKYNICVEQRDNVGSFTLEIGKAKPIVEVSDYSEVSDKIQFTGQRNYYEYNSTSDGMYRFELSEVPNNIYFDMFLYNEDWEELDKNTGISNGRGISHYLEENTKYYISVRQRDSVGSYIMKIGAAKPLVNTSDYIQISDRIQFTDQRNYYEYNSKTNKIYSFTLTDVPNNVYFDMYLYNEDWEELDKNTGISNGNGITYSFKENTKYYVKVQQRDGKGVYTLNINEYVERE